MSRLKEKVAIIVGAGQQPGQTVGNGRAAAERYAQEGASLLLVALTQLGCKTPSKRLQSMAVL
jgi:NAD(P)-dependent dehydrogenase (short-subunit alcohol dehydrogenase family)